MICTETAQPIALLQPLVRMYVQRISERQENGMQEPVVARLGAILEFQFANTYEIPIYGSRSFEACPRVVIVGPITYRRVQLVMRGRVETLAVLFRPCGLHRLFSLPLSLMAEVGTEAHSVLGRKVSQLNERLGNVFTFPDRVRLLNDFFVEQLGHQRGPDRTGQALDKLVDGSLNEVDEAARLSGLSSRQLERQSLARMGVSPKLLVRIARFLRAMNLKERGQSWTDVAHSSGYYDQAHLIHDFRVFAGVTPKQASVEIDPDHLNSLMRRLG